MKQKLFQVDAFAKRIFEGHPAAVCPLDRWLDDATLQSIAMENNLSETAYTVPAGNAYELRWFTPVEEVDLCGHATLAAAHVLFTHYNHSQPNITFHTRSGPLTVTRKDQTYYMDFPITEPAACKPPPELEAALGCAPTEVLAAQDFVVVFEDEQTIRDLTPDFTLLAKLPKRGLLATAPGKQADFVSRCFFPKFNINEDPVTGSAHCQLAPYWAKRLNKTNLQAQQLSKRGGHIGCELQGNRIILAGTAVDYMTAEIQIS